MLGSVLYKREGCECARALVFGGENDLSMCVSVCVVVVGGGVDFR